MDVEVAVPENVRDALGDVRAFLNYMELNPDLLSVADRVFRRMVHRVPITDHCGFYTMRLLTAEGADYFLEAADRLASHFQPNSEEGRQYQIPEIVLAHVEAAQQERLLAELIGLEILWPLFHLMYGNAPNHFSSVQLARYSAPENLGTGWHCDTDSEATCVVSLAPERHMGGGTLLRPRGIFAPAAHLAPLPKGHALLFNGRCTLHKGVPLHSGQRNLLVYWMTAK